MMMSTNWRGYRVAAWVGQALLTIAVIAAVSQGNWQNALALALFLAASVVFVVMQERLPTLFDWEHLSFAKSIFSIERASCRELARSKCKTEMLPFDFLFVFAALLNAGGWVWGLFYQQGH